MKGREQCNYVKEVCSIENHIEENDQLLKITDKCVT